MTLHFDHIEAVCDGQRGFWWVRLMGSIWANGSTEEWMLDIQLGRRDLSSIQRIAVAEKYRPIYKK